MHQRGDRVEVHGLQVDAMHNGKIGEVVKLVFDGHTLRRYYVCLGGTTISVLPGNVRVPGSQHAALRKLAAVACAACVVAATVVQSGAFESARSALCGEPC